jgi:twinkle protein
MNAGELSILLSKEAASVASNLLPNGKKVGREWKAGSLDGEAGQSLSVCLSGVKAGVWKDFSTGEGGDLLDLWAKTRGLSLSEAMDEAKRHLGVRDTAPIKPEKEYRRPAKPTCQTPKSAVREWLLSRGLSEQTIADFKIGEQLRDGKAYAVFPYLRDGELVNAKYRNVAEKKDMRQEGGAEPCLFGWHLMNPNTRMVVLTEGEIDAMTLHQFGIPALSVNAGAGNHQWLENDWDRLERFSDVLIAFDSDEAGKKGAQELSKRIGIDRCKLVTFPAKDANDYLLAGACGEDFWISIKDAKGIDPDELRPAGQFLDRVLSMFSDIRARDPFLRLDQDLPWFEFRAGEYTVWTGYNGHGKSLILNQILIGLAQQDEKFCIFSGEMTPERQLQRMVKQAAGTGKPTKEFITHVIEWLNDRFWLFNQVGSAPLDRLLEVFTYASRRYGIKHFVIDSLMMTDIPEDGNGAISAQKIAVQKMCDFAKRTNSHIHLVAHPRKGQDETKGPGKMDIAGSSKITDGADNVFTVWSARKDDAKTPEDPEKPDGKLELQKQRNGETQHYTQWLWFVKEAQQFVTNSRRMPINYIRFSTLDDAEEF